MLESVRNFRVNKENSENLKPYSYWGYCIICISYQHVFIRFEEEIFLLPDSVTAKNEAKMKMAWFKSKHIPVKDQNYNHFTTYGKT